MIRKMREIGQLLKVQNNRATSDPIFIVQQRRRWYGVDLDYCDDLVYLHCNGFEADVEDNARLETIRKNGGEIPGEWKWTGYADEWDYVTTCFTEAGAQRYIDENRHNLCNPRIYVASGYRNHEWIAIREFLMLLSDGEVDIIRGRKS